MTAATYALPRGMRYLLPGELSARRASRRAAGAARRAVTRAAEVKIPRPAVPHVRDLTPDGFAGYAQASATKVPAALLLLAVIAGIRWLRRGQLPNAHETAGLFIAAIIVAVAASFVPGVVVAMLLAWLLLVALDATPAITAATGRLQDLLGGLGGSAASGAAIGAVGGHR